MVRQTAVALEAAVPTNANADVHGCEMRQSSIHFVPRLTY